MSNFLSYEYRPHDGGVQITFAFEGTIVDATKAIGRLIQQFYGKLDDRIKPAFAFACKQLMDEDSPIWNPHDEETIIVDLKALKKTLEAQQDGTD
ncbi:MAG: hypothetical protein IKG25_10760 [Mogibacterium sp.]|nr:hypothetical protein [Mogibacterium sp.]